MECQRIANAYMLIVEVHFASTLAVSLTADGTLLSDALPPAIACGREPYEPSLASCTSPPLSSSDFVCLLSSLDRPKALVDTLSNPDHSQGRQQCRVVLLSAFQPAWPVATPLTSWSPRPSLVAAVPDIPAHASDNHAASVYWYHSQQRLSAEVSTRCLGRNVENNVV